MAKNEDHELTIAGTVPAVPANGLWEIFDDLIDNPGKVHIGIVFLDAQYVKHETDTGDRSPTVRMKQFEFPTDPEDIKLLTGMADRLQSERTGQMSLMDPEPEP